MIFYGLRRDYEDSNPLILRVFCFSIFIMPQVTIPQAEYTSLQKQATAYRNIARGVFELPLRDSVKNLVEDFRKTDLYANEFLKDLEDGLSKSSFARRRK